MKAVNIITTKTITTRTSILRVLLESAVCVGCVSDDADGVSVTCEMPSEEGTEDCINGLGGTC